MGRLVEQLDDLDLPGIDFAEMLPTASNRMPGEDVAEMLVMAGSRLPSEDTAGLLILASERMPSQDTVEMLTRASDRLPGEDVALLLLQASERMPGQDFLHELDARIRSLEFAIDQLRTPAPSDSREQGRALNHSQGFAAIKDAAWLFWAGLASGFALLTIGVIMGAWMAH